MLIKPQEVNGSVTSEGCEKESNKFAMLFKNKKNGKKSKHVALSLPVRCTVVM